MADNEDRTLPATAKRLAEARRKGDLPISREGSSAAGYLAALLAVLLLGGATAQKIGELILPLIDQPEAFIDGTGSGLRAAGQAALLAVVLALAPLFGLLIASAILPHVVQNTFTISTARLTPKLSRVGPAGALGRLFGLRRLVELGKSLIKMTVVAVACFAVARPIYANSANLSSYDMHALGPLLYQGIVGLLGATTLVAVAIAGFDVPYQHWSYHRRMRMSHQEVRDEAKDAEGNPEVKKKIRRLAIQRARQRMMQSVPKASVVITNPTHYAVALRYERGVDAAPVVVAKGVDLVAQNIKEVARKAGVPTMENRPLARALHASVEIGQVIPREHFEAVAKIIGLIWAQRAPTPRR